MNQFWPWCFCVVEIPSHASVRGWCNCVDDKRRHGGPENPTFCYPPASFNSAQASMRWTHHPNNVDSHSSHTIVIPKLLIIVRPVTLNSHVVSPIFFLFLVPWALVCRLSKVDQRCSCQLEGNAPDSKPVGGSRCRHLLLLELLFRRPRPSKNSEINKTWTELKIDHEHPVGFSLLFYLWLIYISDVYSLCPFLHVNKPRAHRVVLEGMNVLKPFTPPKVC